MTDAEQLLESANSVLIVDWPSRDVPDALARAGYGVVDSQAPGSETRPAAGFPTTPRGKRGGSIADTVRRLDIRK
ncbi:MAG: hypothetical protein QOE10_2715 [Gaiellales bacterium]|nr:hypothetical protein [Gaiellales bacterium]